MNRLCLPYLCRAKRISATVGAIFLLVFAAISYADELQSPTAIIRDITERVVHILQAHEGQPSTLAEQEEIKKIVLPYVDFEVMSKLVMAQYWNQMSPAQQNEFIGLYRAQLIQVYLTAFSRYSGQTVRILASTQISTNPPITQVDTEIIQTDGRQNIPVTYGFVKETGGWKIYDVFIDGVCMNLTYRDTYGRMIAQDGIPKFLDSLKKKEESWHSS
ncbi:ABC transporter substrate-binding protein [Acidithiobacillus sp. AMEEHan]|uniref:MlaC/ttg2D family ABC transporter substrate-binding protein n=1 Tax=Acidithiobacillus sp. AMEEHan TaxID=2994951 RepID=UPI0027E5B0D6|nr:ABC transporter substrate-binding protein [Acidithiobacillus sp. AMEEHan]